MSLDSTGSWLPQKSRLKQDANRFLWTSMHQARSRPLRRPRGDMRIELETTRLQVSQAPRKTPHDRTTPQATAPPPGTGIIGTYDGGSRRFCAVQGDLSRNGNGRSRPIGAPSTTERATTGERKHPRSFLGPKTAIFSLQTPKTCFSASHHHCHRRPSAGAHDPPKCTKPPHEPIPTKARRIRWAHFR